MTTHHINTDHDRERCGKLVSAIIWAMNYSYNQKREFDTEARAYSAWQTIYSILRCGENADYALKRHRDGVNSTMLIDSRAYFTESDAYPFLRVLWSFIYHELLVGTYDE